MISTDHDRRFHFPRPNECVEDKACLLPLAQSEPADSCGQTLKRDALPRLLQPAVEVVVVRKRLHQRVVCGIDVIGVSGQGYPAERPLALAKKGAYVGRHKPGKRERRSEEHTSELQSRENLVCRLLLEKKKTTQ